MDHTRSDRSKLAAQRGFTLVEAMITLTIAAILLTWAVPSLKDFITRNRMSTEVNNFVASFYLARSEAVKRLRNVGICPSDNNGESCTGNDTWKKGWMVFEDTDHSGTYAEEFDNILQLYSALPKRFTVDTSSNGVLYSPSGQLSNVSNTTFKFQDCDNIARSRHVSVSAEGRVRTEQITETVTCG